MAETADWLASAAIQRHVTLRGENTLRIVSSVRFELRKSAILFIFSKHFGGFADVEEMRDGALINLALAEEITAL